MWRLLFVLLLLAGCAASPDSHNPSADIDWVAFYKTVGFIPGPGHFRNGFVQVTVSVVEEGPLVSAAVVEAVGVPSRYTHPIIQKVTSRSICPTALFSLGNLQYVAERVVYPVRYRDGVGSSMFENRGGYSVSNVPLQKGQAGVAVPVGILKDAQNQDPIVTVKILDRQGREVPLLHLVAENRMNAVASTPRNRSAGRPNDFMQYMDLGGFDLLAIVPKGACSGGVL